MLLPVEFVLLAGQGEEMNDSPNTITSLEGLREHLQSAIALEHSTLPPYFCALYSIHPGTNTESVEVIKSVFIEEMLHLVLAANVLNAVGGSPVLDDPGFVPVYPTYLPHSDNAYLIPLAPMTPATIETFLRIERPGERHAASEAEAYETIGQFYRAIEDGLKFLCSTLGPDAVFTGDPQRQISPAMLGFSGDRRVVAVHDLATALLAIDEIEEQGEGLKHRQVWDGDRDMFHPEREEVAHYFRFSEIMQGRTYARGDSPKSGPSGASFDVDWKGVYPMRPNPKMDDYPADSPVRAVMVEFNGLYFEMLRTLHRALNGDPPSLSLGISMMMDLRTIARALMQMPTGDGVTTAGPSFEFVAPALPPSVTTDITIRVRKNGPYIVEGATLVRKSIVRSELEESLTWKKDAVLATDGEFRLCRCGQSSHKPFCDGTHARVDFDGTETATNEPSEGRRVRRVGSGVTLSDDTQLCARAGFCHDHVEDVWAMVERTSDAQVRAKLMHMVEQCPSGRLIYELEGAPVEPDLPRDIAVTKDGPYWVTGEITVELSDGRYLETRNRVTLCRCGQSKNKPLCDGTHKKLGFQDG